MHTFCLSGHSDSITFDIEGYEYSSTSDVSDANWLTGSVRVRVGGFSGAHRVALTTHDLVHLVTDLEVALGGAATLVSFRPYEDVLWFDVRFSRRSISVEGRLKGVDASRAELSFQFETEESRVVKALDEARTIATAYPVRDCAP